MTLPYANMAGLVPVSTGSGTAYTTVPLPSTAGCATLTGAETLANKTVALPRIVDGLLDENGAKILGFGAVDSAVNFLQIDNAGHGLPALLYARGIGENVPLRIYSKGTGLVSIGGDTSTPSLIAGRTLGNLPVLSFFGAPVTVQGDAQEALQFTVARDMPGSTTEEIVARFNLIEDRCNAISAVLRTIGIIA